MDSFEIIDYLGDNDLADIEEIKQGDDFVVVKFYYDFDKDEISAAKSYSNEESDYESESDEWYKDYYIPYLKDIAIDNIEAILEEISDEFEVEAKYKEFGLENGESFKIIAIFSNEMSESEMEDILNDY